MSLFRQLTTLVLITKLTAIKRHTYVHKYKENENSLRQTSESRRYTDELHA